MYVPDRDDLDELRTAVHASLDATDALAPARAAAALLDRVLDLVAEGATARAPGSGLDEASRALLTCDAMLTDAARRAVTGGVAMRALLEAADAERLAARARAIDESGEGS